ncbi:MAG: aldehyde dehydrogenase [Lachnospiraceae bacterium]
MNEIEIQNIIDEQKNFFKTGKTLPVSYRIEALKKLKKLIIENEEIICDAIKKDLGKSRNESYMCEVGLTLSEISYMLKHIRKFASEKTVVTPLAQFASRSYIKPVPYGTVLIMSPWNYPFLLTMEPLVDAIAAGNTCVVKPSAYSPETTKVMTKLIEKCFDKKYVAVITGGRAENSCLLKCEFDYIFFTGSQSVGREVLRNAAEHLTPSTLELGGKSPCIVDETANLRLAAKRIVFGKYLNCGQTCVAPDYLYCHESVRDQLIEYIKEEIKKQFGENPLDNPNYGKIINEKHFDRIMGLIDKEKLICGGIGDHDTLRIAPTVLINVTWDDAVMQEEIFGPILPVLTYTSLDELFKIIGNKPHPLAGYFFSQNKKAIRHFTSTLQFGGGCINDVIIHLATSNMGFGGVGASGMGSYHGKFGFDTFSHKKSIVDKKTWIDLPMRYQPYTRFYDRLIRMFLK